jgi:hypothetical protein
LGQAVHDEAPFEDTVPAGQSWQPWPLLSEYVPAVQDWQLDEPRELYCPAGQLVHAPAPAAEYWFCGLARVREWERG